MGAQPAPGVHPRRQAARRRLPAAAPCAQVDSVCWAGERALLVSCKLLEGGAEQSFAPLCALTWAGGADPTHDTLAVSGGCAGWPWLQPQPRAPSPLQSWAPRLSLSSPSSAAEFFAANIAEHAADQGPWLQAAAVPQVRLRGRPPRPSPRRCSRCLPDARHSPRPHPALLRPLQWAATVYAHRKANDDHIKLAALVGGQPTAADVTDDRLAIRIPNAPGERERAEGWAPSRGRLAPLAMA